jgi:hypothetical protein
MRILSILTHDASNQHGPPGSDDMEKMGKFIAECKSKGVLIDTGGRMPNQLEMIVSRKNGKTSITDGPYTEAKELVGGYALMEVKDREDAIHWTNRFLDLVGDCTCHIHEVESVP